MGIYNTYFCVRIIKSKYINIIIYNIIIYTIRILLVRTSANLYYFCCNTCILLPSYYTCPRDPTVVWLRRWLMDPYAHHTYIYIHISTWKILIRRENNNNNNTKRNLERVNRGLYPHYIGTSELIDRQSREVRESSSL